MVRSDLRIEFARTDDELIHRLRSSEWLRGRQYNLPVWLKNSPPSDGGPSRIPEWRLEQLRDGSKFTPVNNHEYRYIRNKAVIRQIYAEQRAREPERVKPYSFEPSEGSSNEAPASADDEDDLVIVGSRAVASSNQPPIFSAVPTPVSSKDWRAGASSTVTEIAQSSSVTQHESSRNGEPANVVITAHERQRRAPANGEPLQSPSFEPSTVPQFLDRTPPRASRAQRPSPSYEPFTASQGQLLGVSTTSALTLSSTVSRSTRRRTPRRTPRRSSKQPQLNPQAPVYLPAADPQNAAKMRAGAAALRPFFQRAEEDSHVIATLRQQNAELVDQLQQLNTALVQPVNAPRDPTIDRLEQEKIALTRALEYEISIKQETVAALRSMQKSNAAQLDDTPHGSKRKALPESPMRMGDEANGNNEHDASGHLHHLANKIAKDLDQSASNETIQRCGLAPLRIISTRPDEVLALAYQKLNTFPFSKVPTHWRRLFEDATLHKAVEILRFHAATTKAVLGGGGKRRKVDVGALADDWMSGLISVLDKGLQLTGAPGRKSVFEAVFQQLENLIDDNEDTGIPETYRIRRPAKLETERPVERAEGFLSLENFQQWLDRISEPLIIPGTMKEWPATQLWHDPRYLLRLTLGGRRLVPVEIGKSYTDENWGQRIMPLGAFMRTYLLPENPAEVGYLAQYDLFAQIPALRHDVMVPDFCYTTPPDTDEAARKTAGLASVRQLDEPLLNAWLGPKGTKTPLHTDPYHNIFCQVVGYKYIRLYPPSETPNLYPRGVDDKGINEENTSQVDVYHVRPKSLGGSTDLDAKRAQEQKFPRLRDAVYQEAVLGPGECLYVPVGWWHYVESLSTSFSVSFWWN
ncbi:hypothetical protein LTR85_011456 [Meristemomyces frigidus]|nr:hypothetical protein LTR85_011456 [Meristemomyces frigidus]